jgi:sporulation protein YunB
MNSRGRSAARQQKKKRASPLLLVLLAAVVLVFVFDWQIRPNIESMTKYQTKLYATKIVNAAMLQELERMALDYGQLVEIVQAQDGRIVSIQSNMMAINHLKARITDVVLEELKKPGNQKIEIALGTLVGMQATANMGPKMTIHLLPAGYVQTGVKSQFLSAGINQTLHQITLEVEVQMVAAFPGYRVETATAAHYCIAETVIVGAIPEGFASVELGAPAIAQVAGSAAAQ